MEKVKQILRHFLVTEFPILFIFIYGFISVILKKESNLLFNTYLCIYLVFISILNLFLTFVFYFLNKNITKMISVITIFIFSCLAIYLSYNRNYYESLSLDKYPNSFLRDNIGGVLIFLCLLINQLLVKFYYIIWIKVKLIVSKGKKK